MLSLPGMRCKEKQYIKAAIFRVVVENIGSSYIKGNMEIYNNLYNDTQKYILSYIICLFSYDIKHKIKLLLIGGEVLIGGKIKVLLVTLQGDNIGNRLQNYALQKVLQKEIVMYGILIMTIMMK